MVKQEEPIKISVEDLEEPVKAETGQRDIAEELRNLGRQFAEAVQTAWNSEERQRLEKEFKEGVQNFVDEVGKVTKEVKSSPAAERLRSEARKVDTSETASKTKGAVANALHWLSTELAELSEKMKASEAEQAAEEETPPVEKAPPAE